MPLASPKVLLIDDDPIQLRIREAVLRTAGVEVCIATTPESALALLRSESGAGVSVIVTDHVMPQVSGPGFVHSLRAVKPSVPVIVISGMAGLEREYEGLDVIVRQKPCPPADLLALVHAAAESKA